MQDSRDALMLARTSDGRLVQRPLSPHLLAYRLPLAGVLSITHRITGVALSVGTLLMAWWLIAAAGSDAAYATVAGLLGSPFGLLLLFGWTAALWYHFFAGLRHLAWDAGYGYDLPAVRRTNYAVLAATGLFTLASWILWFLL